MLTSLKFKVENKSLNTAANLIIAGILLVGIYFGKALLVPFVIALVVWYLLNSLKNLVDQIKVGGKKLPLPAQFVLSALVFSAISFFVGKLVMVNFEQFVEVYPSYHQNILGMTRSMTQDLNLPISMTEVVQKLNLPNLFSGVLNSSLGFIGNLFLVLIYVIFIGLESTIFNDKLKLMFTDRKQLHRFLTTVRKIDDSIHSYVSIKTGLCLLAAITSYIVLVILGIDFAILWAFMIFLLNFIPIVGALLGVFFPTLIAFLQFPDTYIYALLVLILLSTIQLVIGNFIEPKVLGKRLNLSPLVVILSLSFWGALWGIAGMFLCVPITVIFMIIFSQFPQTRRIAILLSGGKIIQS